MIEFVRSWSRRQQVAAGVGVLLAAAGLLVVVTSGSGSAHQAVPPTPPSPIASVVPRSVAPSSSHAAPSPTSSPVAVARLRCTTGGAHSSGIGAIHLCIPSIGVNTDVIALGLNPDRTVQVPPLSEVGLAGWYKYSPAPGVVGPSVILGHIDSAQYGEGVFFRLGTLRRGAMVWVERADEMLAGYRVDRVAEYAKSAFPTAAVYGDTSKPTLRLITCGGRFDPSAGSYLDNIVAYGTLMSLRRV